MVRTFGRTLRRTAPLVVVAQIALVALLAGCGAPEVHAARIVATLRTQLVGQGVPADDLRCPDLPAEVGRSVRCTFTVEGQPVDAVAAVSAVDGDDVTYEVHTEARPVARQVLERAVARTLATNGGPPGALTCAADLPPQVGATTTCTLTGADGATEWTVRAASVDGGKVDYSIEQAGLT